MANGCREASRYRPAAAKQAAGAQTRRNHPRTQFPERFNNAGLRRRARRRHRRRPAAPHIHGLPSGAFRRSPRGAHAAFAGRSDDRRDRARVPRPGIYNRAAEFSLRLSSVLEVIYLIFNEGYSATAGESWMRLELCDEALRLGRILAGLVPKEPEVHGLVALMEIQASRARARIGPSGAIVPLFEQKRARWDQLLIRRGLAALARAEALGGALGPYTLQAAIAACHARARTAGKTDWLRIVALYDALAQLAPSPVVELNRAVAVGMAFGPEAGLELVDELISEPSLKSYHLLPSVRGHLLAKLDRNEEARAEFERAAALTHNERERELLLKRAAACARRRRPGEVD